MRDSHSASSIALGGRCRRAWAYRYIANLRDADVPWAAIMRGAPATSRQRSCALGSAVHATIERWYGFGGDDPRAEGAGAPGRPNWEWYPGQVARAGLALLPDPAACRAVVVESKAIIDAHGVRWTTVPDLVALPTEDESERLGVRGGWLLVDHKTSSNPGRYALNAERLHDDVQANLYALRVAQDRRLDGVPARWIYYDTTPAVGTRHEPRVARGRAFAVDTVIDRDQALHRLEAPAALARELDAIERVADAPMNLDACRDYGGCPFHKSAGGPCDARRSIAAFVSARTSKGTMTKEELQAKFAAATAATATAPASAPTPAPAEAAPPAAAPRPRGRPRKEAPEPEPEPVEEPDATPPKGDTAADAVLELAAELTDRRADLRDAFLALAEAQAKHEAADAAVRETLDAIRQAAS